MECDTKENEWSLDLITRHLQTRFRYYFLEPPTLRDSIQMLLNWTIRHFGTRSRLKGWFGTQLGTARKGERRPVTLISDAWGGSETSPVIIEKSTTFENPNLCPRHNLATFRIRKINVNFYQSEESNPVVSLTTLLWGVTGWFFAHRVGEIIHFAQRSFAGWELRKNRGTNIAEAFHISCTLLPWILYWWLHILKKILQNMS